MILICILWVIFLIPPKILPENMEMVSENRELFADTAENKIQTIKTFLEVNLVRHESEITGEVSVYDFMSKLRNEGKIYFTEKNYVGMGKLILSINGLKSNGDRTWIYYVNGQKAQVGVSNYKINPGDVVSWKYEEAHY